MSVLYEIGAEVRLFDVPSPWICEGCGEAIEPPCVHWFGRRALLWHPACATAIGTHLIADAREATLAAAPSAHWRQRSVRAVRHRLLAGEMVA